MQPFPLTLLVFLLCTQAEAGEIIGGTECRPHSRPYMAFLEIRTKQGYRATCGGFLIRRRFVLTAAHCYGRAIRVTLGAHNVEKKEDTQQKIEVEEQFIHPKYDEDAILNDIMLLKLKEKANLTLAVGTLPLPSESNFIPPGKMCRVTGWGKTSVTGHGSEILREVKQRLMAPQTCEHYHTFNHESQLCVGSPKKISSAYEGDSGGPLLCAGVAHGIVSYGQFNAKPPAVFTRISHFRPWIDKILKDN